MWKKSSINERFESDIEGNIRTFHRGWNRFIKPKIKEDKDGYLIFSARNREGISTTYRVHRVVASAWIPNIENKPTVNHKNGDKKDNRVENLEWATISENTQHAYDFLGVISAQSRSLALFIDDKFFSTYNSINVLCEKIGIDRGSLFKLFKDSEYYFRAEDINTEEFREDHNKRIWKDDFKLNTRGRYYEYEEQVYDKISDIREDFNLSKDQVYNRINKGEIVVISPKEFLKRTKNKNW